MRAQSWASQGRYTMQLREFLRRPRKRTLVDAYRGIDESTVDKWDAYLDIYEYLFAPLRKKRVSLLEIGVFRGGSLKLWQTYFAADSTIVGIDKVPETRGFAAGNLHIEIGDQVDGNFLREIIDRYGEF